ncbi:hypothetical protein BCIN_01g01540 [Botrytis cinerea B05.10]|uniref:Uncharacterized protein n=1 Tax=Botryotinia fuckeliana (strain B05.10) TaxID=332648 RepID=A0A384J4B6_BOTFB|nr:hypothetical protein BCIN_01g01540 [Botrytis cinerea B05.10]ATZ45358.1 hypothetical protein BCIN_01g01540 [Botrytis cinerea B05.10]
MHYQFLPYFLLAFFTSLLPASASPLYYSPSPRDNNQIRSTRTTICLSDYFGGCCAIDEHGNYGSCTNATLLGSNVPWTGMPTTQTANEWACTNPVNGTIDTTYPNGVVLPTLQKSMACTASNAGLSKSKRMEDSDGVMKRGWGDVWSFW